MVSVPSGWAPRRGCPWGWVLAGIVCSLAVAVADEATARRAESLRRKLALILQQAQVPAKGPYATAITEEELNAYLQQHAAELMPAGVTDPRVTIVGDGRVAAEAVIDFDLVRQSRPRPRLDPLAYLAGRVPVAATGILRTANGIGRLELEAARVAGLSVPKGLVYELVAAYTRRGDRPDGLDLEAPFALPAGIREIRVGKGRAVVVQ
jgi:hypothetical protein